MWGPTYLRFKNIVHGELYNSLGQFVSFKLLYAYVRKVSERSLPNRWMRMCEKRRNVPRLAKRYSHMADVYVLGLALSIG